MIDQLNPDWKQQNIIAFDTETSGKYPLESEICEIGAVKWKNGKIIDKFQTLIKPSIPMGDAVIKIHGITNEMVSKSPSIDEVLPKFINFIEDSLLLAHHAPFDLGFLAAELEKISMVLPTNLCLCTSLLSRSLFPESKNHRLQTLIQFFNINQGQAHRALDDAIACLEVGLKCLNKISDSKVLSSKDLIWEEAFKIQAYKLTCDRFSIRKIEKKFQLIVKAIQDKKKLAVKYSKGSRPGVPRFVYPVGLVRSLNGDFFISQEPGSNIAKRFLLSRLIDLAENIDELS